MPRLPTPLWLALLASVLLWPQVGHAEREAWSAHRGFSLRAPPGDVATHRATPAPLLLKKLTDGRGPAPRGDGTGDTAGPPAAAGLPPASTPCAVPVAGAVPPAPVPPRFSPRFPTGPP
ncbi:MAG TPA: hypothetical protein VFS33_07235 [Gemmatimonadales bacterium]|nr:hypothetical protein [Gemmatimonadales bacterium]